MFEVWNDREWSCDSEVYSFDTLLEAISFALEMSGIDDDANDCVDFFNRTKYRSIGIGDWCVGEKRA